MTDRATDVMDLERDFWLLGGANPQFWQKHCAEEAIIALPMGLMTKADTVEAMAAARPWETVRFDDVRTMARGDTVLVSYLASGRAEGELDNYEAVVSSAYGRYDGDWKLIFHQQSPTV